MGRRDKFQVIRLCINHSAIGFGYILGRVITVAGSRFGGYLDGLGADALFSSPMGITVDDQNTLYVADYGNNCIRQITSTGIGI